MSSGADDLDMASEHEEFFRVEALKKVTKPKVRPSGWTGPECYDCELEVNEARLALGYWVCISCQTAKENQRKFFRG